MSGCVTLPLTQRTLGIEVLLSLEALCVPMPKGLQFSQLLQKRAAYWGLPDNLQRVAVIAAQTMKNMS